MDNSRVMLAGRDPASDMPPPLGPPLLPPSPAGLQQAKKKVGLPSEGRQWLSGLQFIPIPSS